MLSVLLSESHRRCGQESRIPLFPPLWMDIGAPELRELRRSGDFRGESQLEFLRVAEYSPTRIIGAAEGVKDRAIQAIFQISGLSALGSAARSDGGTRQGFVSRKIIPMMPMAVKPEGNMALLDPATGGGGIPQAAVPGFGPALLGEQRVVTDHDPQSGFQTPAELLQVLPLSETYRAAGIPKTDMRTGCVHSNQPDGPHPAGKRIATIGEPNTLLPGGKETFKGPGLCRCAHIVIVIARYGDPRTWGISRQSQQASRLFYLGGKTKQGSIACENHGVGPSLEDLGTQESGQGLGLGQSCSTTQQVYIEPTHQAFVAPIPPRSAWLRRRHMDITEMEQSDHTLSTKAYGFPTRAERA